MISTSPSITDPWTVLTLRRVADEQSFARLTGWQRFKLWLREVLRFAVGPRDYAPDDGSAIL